MSIKRLGSYLPVANNIIKLKDSKLQSLVIEQII